MPTEVCRRPRAGLVFWTAAALWVLAGCSSFNSASQRLANVVTPYRADVVQGNFVSREQVEVLQAGMSRQQVREILGTPLVTSLFHADRWEYVFSVQRLGEPLQTRKLTVYFERDLLVRHEGDTMPSEAEFVASLGSKRKAGAPTPVLEATETQLARHRVTAPPAAPAAPLPPADPAKRYPPLESTGR